jgi:SAM-dependent methyltransferase
MDDPSYAIGIVRGHVARAGIGFLEGRVVLELGPGDSAATAVIAAAMGGRAILVDVGAFVPSDAEPYRKLAFELHQMGLTPPDLSRSVTLHDVLHACGAEYRSDGLNSLRDIASGSADLVFSHAVLEHVRRAEVRETLQELNRILRSGGVASHRVDLRDHLGGGLANLRFPSGLWESQAFATSGFYTNRIGVSEFDSIFRSVFRDVSTRAIAEWSDLPIPRTRLSGEFRHRSDRDLCVQSFDAVMHRRDPSS